MDQVEPGEALGAVLERASGGLQLLGARERERPAALRRLQRVRYLMVATDALAIMAAHMFAFSVDVVRGGSGVVLLVSALAATPVAIAVLAAYDLYSVCRRTGGEEFRRLLSAVSVSVLLIMLLSAWSKEEFSREWVALSWASSLACVVGTRVVWHRWLHRETAEGRLSLRTLILGTNDEAERVAAGMAPDSGFELIGHIETAHSRPGLDGVSVVGDVDELQEVVRATRAECVFVACSAVGVEDMRQVSKLARILGLEVRLSTNIPEVSASRVGVQALAGLTTLSVRPVKLTSFQSSCKRAFDLVVTAVLAAATAPLWIAIALAIKLSSPGPVLFKQARVGRGGRTFIMYKFRTMVANAEEVLTELRALNEASGPLFKISNDPRATAVGRLLRRSSLDELPQLLNVLKGDMSLVGPRPPLRLEVDAYAEGWHFDRLEVLPGITGLWQVSGRSTLSFDDYMRLDVSYVENWSLGLDLWILAKTPPAVLSQRGAF